VVEANRQSFAKVFSNWRFLLLWFGQLNSQLADRIYVYVLMIIAYNLTGGSNLGVSVPLLAFGLPSLLFGPLAGVYVDRWNRKWILTITSIIRGALILLIVPLINQSMILIFLVSLLIYTAMQFFAPAESASIPELVEKHDLIVANSLFMMTWMGASVIGFGLGAPLVNFFGNEVTFVVAAILYFVAAGAVFLIPLKPKPHNAEQPGTVLKHLMLGIEFIRRNSIVRYSLLKLFVATSAIAVISLLAISYAKDVLEIGAKNFGYLIIAVGVGMFIGMWILERLRRYVSMGMIVIVSFIVSGLTLVYIGTISDLKIALLLISILGMGNIFITSSIQTILQQRIPRFIRGRVFGVQNMLINSAFVFPVILAGIIADMYGVRFALELLGWLVALTGVAGIFLPKFRAV